MTGAHQYHGSSQFCGIYHFFGTGGSYEAASVLAVELTSRYRGSNQFRGSLTRPKRFQTLFIVMLLNSRLQFDVALVISVAVLAEIPLKSS